MNLDSMKETFNNSRNYDTEAVLVVWKTKGTRTVVIIDNKKHLRDKIIDKTTMIDMVFMSMPL